MTGATAGGLVLTVLLLGVYAAYFSGLWIVH
jgi:hypothetical protein